MTAQQRRPLYAIGDVHGDANRLLQVMTAHQLVEIRDGTVRWIKPNVIVILMGDVVDAKSRMGEGGDVLFQGSKSDMWIVEFLMVAAEEASKVGSSLYALMGNHELMNFRGDFRYASPYHVRDPHKRHAYFTTGDGFRAFESMFLTSITYNRAHYSHAGIPLETTPLQDRLIDKRVNADLLRLDGPDLEDLVSHRDYYDASDGPRDDRIDALDGILAARGVDRLVVGHNYTHGQGVVADFGGRVVFTDVGISKAFAPRASAESMQILYDRGDGTLCALDPDGTMRPIAIRAAR